MTIMTPSHLYGILGLLLVVISYKDLTQKRIPNILVLYVIALSAFHPVKAENFLCALLLATLTIGLARLYHKYKKTIALGTGDIKLFTACGFWITFTQIPFFLILTGISGIIWGVAWHHFTGEKKFPFAPCIGLGILSTLLLR